MPYLATIFRKLRFASHFLLFITPVCSGPVHARAAPPNKLNPDSIRAETLCLRTDLEETRANLRTSYRKFRTGILVSGIDYTVTITGRILLGSEDYSDRGQPLVLAGGVVGFSGAILLLNSNRFIGRAGGIPAQLPAVPDQRATTLLRTNDTNRAP